MEMNRQSSLLVPKVSITGEAEDSEDNGSIYSIDNSNNRDDDSSNNDDDDDEEQFVMPEVLLALRQLPAVADICDTEKEAVYENAFFWRLRAYQARPATRDWRRQENNIMCQQISSKIVQLVGKVRAGSLLASHNILCTNFGLASTEQKNMTNFPSNDNEEVASVFKYATELINPGSASAELLAYQVQDWLLQLLNLLPVWLAFKLQRGALDYEMQQDADVALIARLQASLNEIRFATAQELSRLRTHDEVRQKAIQRSLGLCAASTYAGGMQHKRSHRLSGVLLQASLLAYRPAVRHRRRYGFKQKRCENDKTKWTVLRQILTSWLYNHAKIEVLATVYFEATRVVSSCATLANQVWGLLYQHTWLKACQWPVLLAACCSKMGTWVYRQAPPAYWTGIVLLCSASLGFMLGLLLWPM